MDFEWRKLVSAGFLIFVGLTILVPNKFWCGPDFGKYPWFVVSSIILFVFSLILVPASGWSFRKNPSIWDFLRLFLSRYFVGEMITSLYGLFIFILFAIVLTSWLPDAFTMGEYWFLLGNVFYFLSIVFLTAFVYPAPARKPRLEHPKTKHLVYGLSYPSKTWNLIEKAKCEDMKRNRKILSMENKSVNCKSLKCGEDPKSQKNMNGGPVSLFPLYVSMYYHFSAGPLEYVHLIVTKSAHFEKDSPCLKKDVKENLRLFFRKASKCLKARFSVNWPCGGREEIVPPEGDLKRVINVDFIPISDHNDVKRTFQEIGKSQIASLLEENSGDVTFHLTGGTAPMSIAMMLHAIKGDTHAEYAKQNVFDVEPEELLVSVDMNVLDLEDLAKELKRYFEREYEKRLVK